LSAATSTHVLRVALSVSVTFAFALARCHFVSLSTTHAPVASSFARDADFLETDFLRDKLSGVFALVSFEDFFCEGIHIHEK
jgi:hypothetical protein